MEADIPRILELYRQLVLDPPEREMVKSEPEFSQKAFREMSSLEGYYLLVAEVDGEVGNGRLQSRQHILPEAVRVIVIGVQREPSKMIYNFRFGIYDPFLTSCFCLR